MSNGTISAALAALVVLVHLAFVIWAAAGVLLVLRWPRFALIHIPAAAWAAYIELSGRVCPLTPLENALRRRAGLDDYSGDFVAAYLLPMLYPDGLTRGVQVILGLIVLAINLAGYSWLAIRGRRRRVADRERGR